ncbi:type IA DNA topoisomerase [Arthrobacter bambusae]|uniref:DNA topoisomerase-3 n=1 Tax=Arthrobacter bambusae TaxID=1338426 RepID=A0AAW8DFZ3_9MICC|nr:type IA DNA topoisomerase [Arthrobacter bambusae]MDP9904562.1 DNA topoisomerase-3 [Arthrobacter bambusae]MDQ0129377.1 DNA topoisomerase-3 [Arthrobacter bambusae]MDQ0181010.1 DNA topoisomerase-3 [Arthrobacter bambusae]
MTVGLLTEKPSQARAFAAALGGMEGIYNGEQYVIAHARGHLYELAQPENQVQGATADEQEKLRVWSLENLPWDLDRFAWKNEPLRDTKDLLRDIASKFANCDTICAAGDLDPSGEGGLIFSNVVKGLGLENKKLERMYFLDEAAASIQKAFTSRRSIASIDQFDEYRKASYRNAWDFASIQFTRAATLASAQRGMVLRQGRLKSAMVKLVGDQKKAHDDYVRKPFFQNRFRDENGVMYTNSEEPTFDQNDQVPQSYHASAVVVDAKSNKTTTPPRLLDLAGLSALMAKQGMKPAYVLKVVQAGYERQYFSYPRTEDKTITPEQFNELAPLVDEIAAVVGVDATLLTHRTPRGTHVKPQGAHGANRPGLNVPKSLAALETELGEGAGAIYTALAKNYLAMLADDYRYEQQKGHVKDYVDFVGIANVPQSQGWKAVFDADADESASSDENESPKGLGKNAEPFVFEGANKRPEHPSMKWLMKQLEKHDVGTGATRTSTYAEVTNERAKHPLLIDRRGKLTLAEAGTMSWMLLPGTHIGDLALTEKVYADMKDIAAGTATAEERLAIVADWVREDIATMQKNATAMRSTLGLKEEAVAQKERVSGTWGTRQVTFAREFGGHRFSDEEVEKLLAGETIDFQATSRQGKTYDVFGQLGEGTFKGKKFVGFQRLGFGRRDPSGAVLPPKDWCGHVFNPGEIQKLMAGEAIEAGDFVSSKTGNNFSCKVSWDAKTQKIVPDFGTSGDEPPMSWCGVQLTESQRRDLAAGKTIEGAGFVSKKTGKSFSCKLTWKEEKGAKKLVPSFK